MGSEAAYGPGGGSDEAGQTLSYKLTTIPSNITLWKADGITSVATNATLTLAEVAGPHGGDRAQRLNGSGILAWTVQDSGGTAGGVTSTLTETLAITVNAVADTLGDNCDDQRRHAVEQRPGDIAQPGRRRRGDAFQDYRHRQRHALQERRHRCGDHRRQITVAEGNARAEVHAEREFQWQRQLHGAGLDLERGRGLGGGTASATITVDAVKRCSVISGTATNATLTSITEDDIGNAGQTVASLIATMGAGAFSDPDGVGAARHRHLHQQPQWRGHLAILDQRRRHLMDLALYRARRPCCCDVDLVRMGGTERTVAAPTSVPGLGPIQRCGGHQRSTSAPTAAAAFSPLLTRKRAISVANVNDAPTGGVTIDNTTPARATRSRRATPWPMRTAWAPSPTPWKADGVVVGSGATYVLTEAEVGKAMTVEASYPTATARTKS